MYDEANTNYRFEEMVTKKYFVHHPSDLLTPADQCLRPPLGEYRASGAVPPDFRVSLQSYHTPFDGRLTYFFQDYFFAKNSLT